MLKKLSLALVFVLTATFAFSAPLKIGFTQIVEHPALDANRQGVIDRLTELGYKEGTDVVYDIQIAQGNMATAGMIAKRFVGESTDLIVAIATPTAMAAAKATKDIPIVISAVTDPVGAKLVQSLEKPGGNVTGTTDLSPVAEQFKLFKEVAPDAKTIGVLYNAGETNSVSIVNIVKEVAAKMGYKIEEGTAANSAAVMAAAKSMVGRADAIYVPTDNTVVSALEAVIKVCRDNKIPLINADTDSVARGSIAALAIDYYKLGQQTGDMVDKILKGTKPADIPVETLKEFELHVNPEGAKAMGVTLSDAFMKKASKIHK